MSWIYETIDLGAEIVDFETDSDSAAYSSSLELESSDFDPSDVNNSETYGSELDAYQASHGPSSIKYCILEQHFMKHTMGQWYPVKGFANVWKYSPY
jgi:hypothetical protein